MLTRSLLLQLGNPLLEYATDFNSRAEFFWSHGLISDSTYKMFTAGCNYSQYVSEYYRNSISLLCSKVMSQVSRETSKFVDKYDVTLDVCISSVLSQSKVICHQNHVSIVFWRFFHATSLPSYHLILILHFQIGLIIVIWEILSLFQTACKWEYRCMCRWQSYKLLKQTRCTKGAPCRAYWSSKVECLQQVYSSILKQINTIYRSVWINNWIKRL